MTRLLLVRHGRSEANAQRRVQGWLDSPLDDVGRAQARAIALRLQHEAPEIVYTSPLCRAQETAEAIAQALSIPLVADERLRERGVGAITGLTNEEIGARFPGFQEQWQQSRKMVAPPEGEQPAPFYTRVQAAFQSIIDRHPHGNVVVVTHGGVLASYLAQLLDMPEGYWAPFSFGNGSLSIVDLNGADFRVRLINDRCHLNED